MKCKRFQGIWTPGPRWVAVLAALLIASTWLGATPASATTLTVCHSGCAYTQIGPAVAAASSGDTIRIGPGTYEGGITIDISLQLVGAGPAATIISGGGSVLTIGTVLASSEPTVWISGVRITGGFAQTSPESISFLGVDGAWAAGGGVEIPPDASTGGATVTISNSVITGNRVDPTTGVDSGIPCPGFSDGDCPFAPALGGGIDSWGTLTLVNTVVSNNSVGSAAGLASDADGAGICSEQGSLTLDNTVVSGNHAIAASPDGRFAEGAGIDVGCFGTPDDDSLTVKSSVITANSATLTSDLPSFFGGQLISLAANSGGIEVANGIPTTVANSLLTKNSAVANDPYGEPLGIDAGIHVNDSPLTMSDSVVSDNQSVTEAATTYDVGPAGSALEADGGGTITNTVIVGNAASVVSPSGVASVNGAVFVANFTGDSQLVTIRNSTITDNAATASSTSGSATVEGGGIFNDALLDLIGDSVSDNNGTASGPSGVAQGGGIWNGFNPSIGGNGPIQLTLQSSTVTRNWLTGSPGVTLQGAGLFTASPATLSLMRSLIAFNRPDQCFGC